MSVIATRRLSEFVGAEVVDVDVDRMLHDDDLPTACLRALEENGVLLFRELNIDDEAQIAFGRKLGRLAQIPGYRSPEVMEISFDPANPNAQYFPSNDHWHFDGSMDDIPAKAALMSARVITDEGGETEFASTYVAYDALSDEEKDRFAGLRILHTFESIQRRTYQDPTPEQLEDWASWEDREHPLVWEHESGRRSLVFGASAARVIGMDVEESRALLADLERRSTAPDRVLRHSWSVGDLVIWDNLGLVHRACPFDRTQPRRMHRTTLAGEEAIR
ncbi:TauD/TfdA dioxygenase family protein [Pseudofrankia inefficax]|uniref:Taurine catabolism dioxygenase TauD/TfdA n=1 Tax=Pseudofrankia inefficax (strain DSM 45817 / CECT 9037 / DDB 130130 / EuI1c) TaxID=298654 RepID=E3IU80_PSEI1|nr:TauD/TfdA family dioxygenase [Pseudofrankia inefficax]ADP82417.1 Taurine catabolism dioxygenase TauD/TfdA [Pseudofrankia inefficax]